MISGFEKIVEERIQSVQKRAVLDRKLPDRLPFIDRIEIWYKGMKTRGTMPPEYDDMSLNDVHKAVGIGREKFFPPYARSGDAHFL